MKNKQTEILRNESEQSAQIIATYCNMLIKQTNIYERILKDIDNIVRTEPDDALDKIRDILSDETLSEYLHQC